MLIVCPSCAKPYELDPVAIGMDGRSVRCIRCKNVWFAAPPAEVPVLRVPEPALKAAQQTVDSPAAANDEAVAAFRDALGGKARTPTSEMRSPEPAPAANGEGPAAEGRASAASEPPAGPTLDDPGAAQPADPSPVPNADAAAGAPAKPAAVAVTEIPVAVEDAPPLAPTDDDGEPGTANAPANENGPEDIESVARRRVRARARQRRARPAAWLPGLILVLAALCATLLGWRKDIVRHVPQLASFYASIGLPVNLRGLAFTDVKLRSEMHDGVPVLLVEGTIVSTVSTPAEVPRLRFALRNAAGAEVYAWTAMPTQSVLEPGGKLPFRSRLASPPKDGHGLQVRFFTRRDVVSDSR
jgi:predicted Zn finger-like uncharacterized protein